MVTISLDEYGEFERKDQVEEDSQKNNKKKNGSDTQEAVEKDPTFIGGLIYDDASAKEDTKHERARIEAYYRRVIADVKARAQVHRNQFKYPSALHSNGDTERDQKVVKKIKKEINKTLAEFLSKGTYKGISLSDQDGDTIPLRRGKYRLFVMLKSDDGKKNLLGKSVNAISDDNFAANRYFHMASSVVNRIIFHNPIYKKNLSAINLDIATRSTGNKRQMAERLVKELDKQRYRKNPTKDQQDIYYTIMGPDNYRSIIAQEMVSSGKTNVQIQDLNVCSIQYKENAKKMEFLYMADSICSYLSYMKEEQKKQIQNVNEWLDIIKSRINEINPNEENLVFGYDEIDNDFADAWRQYEENHLFDALSIAYDAKIKKGTFAEHYRDTWFPYLEKRVQSTINPGSFAKNVSDLSDMLIVNNLDQEKLQYLMQQFETMVPTVSPQYYSADMRARVLYKLYDAGISAYCHVGASDIALEYYEKQKPYQFYVGIDDFLRTNNKVVVCLESLFRWDEALKLANETIAHQKHLSEMKREILHQPEELSSLDEAKSISQKARVLALMHDPDTEKLFREALAKMDQRTKNGKQTSANYKITQSYLLHYLADTRQKEAFEKEATDYFDGREDYGERLDYIIKQKETSYALFSNEYALYVLLRGLYYFNQDKITKRMWQELCDIEKTLEKKDGHAPSAHPWEITYKYLEMLAIVRGDQKNRDKYHELKRQCVTQRGNFMEVLEAFGDAEVAEAAKDTKERDRITKELAADLTKEFDALKDVVFSEDGQKRYNEMEQYFTFMNR